LNGRSVYDGAAAPGKAASLTKVVERGIAGMVVRRKPSEARRRNILQAAVTVIGERGLCDTRISDIAQRSDSSSALVLYYFGSKDRLLAEALAFSEERFYTETADEVATVESATEQLVRLIRRSCSPGAASRQNWHDEWTLYLDLWARSARDPEVGKDREALDRRWRETIAAIVRTGQDRGEFAAVDADDFALRLSVMLDGLAIQVVLEDPEVTPERMTEICLRMAATELGFEMPRVRKAPAKRRTARTRKPARTA
jgi:AcrR family transcriptional regulator